MQRVLIKRRVFILRLLHRVRGGFPLNFGREAVCELINKAEKGDWKNCVVSDDQEEHYAAKFREIFEKFDPFLNADDSSSSEDDETQEVSNGNEAKAIQA